MTDVPKTSPAHLSGPVSHCAAGPCPLGVDRLFRCQVQRAADAVAIEYRDQQWTYGELDRRATRLAQYLRSLGVGPNILVGLCLERGPEMVMAILAVIKAGGAYLPLDATYPRERLALMLDDAQVPLVLTEASLVGRLPQDAVRLVCLDQRVGDYRSAANGVPLRPVQPDELAYAIYTSGSTGRPKAVLIEHRGLSHLVLAQQASLGMTPQSRVLQLASLSFDASVSEIFVTLLSGATLCLADPWQLSPGPGLVRTLRTMRITMATIPPSILLMLGAARLPQLQTLIVAGERCPADVASRWSVGRRLVNAYGPTEVTVCATMYVCPEGPQPAPPIGRALPHCELLVLDDQRRPVTNGAAGELLIGGPAVARGYLNRPELTSDRFVPHPLADRRAARMYRTGDRVRYLADGNLEFLGRIDRQVKIHGVRIELDEITAVLERQRGVARAVALRHDDGGRTQLVAFAVGCAGHRPSAVRLRAQLKRLLPRSMVPAKILVLERLPLTTNGKIDHAALLAAVPASAPRRATARPPRDALELALVQVWQQLLDRPTVGITEDFFDIGGDSLRALELLAVIERRWGQRLSAAALLAGPTVEKLAATLRYRTDRADWSPVVAIRPGGSRRPFFCVHPGGGNALCYLDLARHLADDQPFFALQAPGIDGLRPPLETVEDMAAEYVAAIQRLQPRGPYLLGGWSFGGIIAYEMARQLEDQSEPVRLLAILDAGMVYSFAVVRTLFPDDNVPLVHMGAIDPTKQLEYFRRYGAKAQLIPPGAGETLARSILKIFQVSVEATYNYRPRRYGGKIDLFLASERFIRVRVRRDPYLEWSDLCAGPVERHAVPGNHLTMIHPPHVRTLAQRLQTCIDRATPVARVRSRTGPALNTGQGGRAGN